MTRVVSGCVRNGVLLLLAVPAAAQILTENAGVVSPETPILREVLAFTETENLRELRLATQFTFALDPAHELRLSLPWLRREVEPPGSGVERDLEGLGDLSLRFKRAVWKHDEVMASTRAALLLEVTPPTGEDDDTVRGVAIPPRMRLSPGHWSFGAGGAYTWIRDRERFSAELLLRHRTRHDGVRLGGGADLNLAWWYRISPAAFSPQAEETEVRGVIELLTSARADSRIGGSSADDGGFVTALAPGIQVYPSKRVLLEASLVLPVLDEVDDALGDRRYAVLLSLKFPF